MSRCGFGSIFEGAKRLRGVPAVTPSSVARMTRKSWKVRPGDTRLTFWNAWGSIVSRASTITLRTPSCSMNAITCCWAPAPIDSMATTAATPKIMPSMVNSDRSLWTRRLSKPSCRSCSQVPSSEFGSRSRAFTELGPGSGLQGPCAPATLSFSGQRIAQRHLRTRREVGHHDVGFGAVRDFDLARLERPAPAYEHDRLAVLLEERLAGQIAR